MYAAIRKACAECGLTWINKYKRTKDVRRGLNDLKQDYYGVNPFKEVFGKIMNNIQHASYRRDNSGNSYKSYTGLLRECF